MRRRTAQIVTSLLLITLRASASQTWTDTSGHSVTFVTVSADVKLEVLDWGGGGPAILLLAGGGNTAHVFDHFAHQFTQSFRVIGLTRRGYGASSRPLSGYDLGTLTRDILSILDQLKIDRVILIGHSRAGAELTRLAVSNPARVIALVYLDAAIDRSKPPQAVGPQRAITDADLASVERFNAWLARKRGMRYPEAEIRAIREVGPDGRVGITTTPTDLNEKISAGVDERPAYDKIQAPALAIYAPGTLRSLFPNYEELDAEEKALADRRFSEDVALKEASIAQFRSEVKHSKVVVLDSGVHHIFLSNESEVVRLISTFLSDVLAR